MKKIKLLVVAAILAAGTFFFTSEDLVKADVSKEAVIKEGVYIGGIDVGGMTAEEATAAVDAYIAEIQEQWITLVGPKNTLKYQFKDLVVTGKTSVAVQEAVAIGNTGNVIKRFKALQDLEKEDRVIDMGLTIDKQVVANKIYGKRSKIDVEAIDNGLKKENGKFVYVPGQEGNEVDIVTSVNELNEYIGSVWELGKVENPEFTLTSVMSQPRGTEEELAKIKDLLATHTTNYGNISSASRAQNIENGVSKINGAVLYPGDQFSFYEYVNPFTAENGYALSGSYLDGATVQTYGGGICQVVTTLYNAALKAELEITQRFAHSMTVSYEPPGGDAAISGTYKDLRFKNNYDFPIYVEAICHYGNVTFNIYGVETRPSNRKIISESDPGIVYTLSDSYAVGVYRHEASKHMAYVAKFWKIVTIDGVQTEKIQINKSTYRASAGKATIGIAGATAEQLAAINAAVATKDDAHIRAVVASLVNPVTPPTTEQPTNPDNNGEEGTTPEQPSNPDNGGEEGTTPEQPSNPDNGGEEGTTPETGDSGSN